ncbi:hypothetical protein M413DRAFT_318131 [Hebeloma cylindrosporum]|uniref:Uncharacterized protein n=1 Tax=Hebeloma cylindrosporum TaxID=76867 RepID=A0A0C2Z004_HEBCY|nr:hypothetical protein M413DRAFT_318131 [Hebeloma cylindrosporum h7]
MNDSEFTRSPQPANWRDDDGEAICDEDFEHGLPQPFTFFVNPQNGQTYHFYGTRYIAAATKPGIEATEGGENATPKMLYIGWPSLVKAGFGNINAVLRNPYNRDQTFFFFDIKYALIETKSTSTREFRLLGESRLIEDDWRSLRDANFGNMDAFLPCPGNNQEAYVFSEEMYILIHIGPDPNTDRLISGPTKIEDDWRSFKEAGFRKILTILPVADNLDQAYVFSASGGWEIFTVHYMLVEGITSGPHNVEIIDGPKPVYGNWSLPLISSGIQAPILGPTIYGKTL